ncbi:flagellar basal body L-ring protein FlgH [Plesiomonas sp.]|uniref:flagellar basal body L-ring protein FlgH n=1 Tax=Plesiomonas sp. TaxID=2486279 RepID=UPI003F2B7FE4
MNLLSTPLANTHINTLNNRHRRKARALIPCLLLLVSGLLSGCAQPSKPIADDPNWAPVEPPPAVKPPVELTGSLFIKPQGGGLYSDIKAHRVGDIITVQLRENTKAKKNANTDLSKESKANLTSPVIAGRPVTINGVPLSFGLENSNDFQGGSAADQSNSLSGAISVEVVQVLSNGNLRVRGEKWITLNNGEEFIRLTGTIRPEDISPDNVLESPKMSNARIQYSGTGAFSDTQKQGWLSRFFNSEWFPF